MFQSAVSSEYCCGGAFLLAYGAVVTMVGSLVRVFSPLSPFHQIFGALVIKIDRYINQNKTNKYFQTVCTLFTVKRQALQLHVEPSHYAISLFKVLWLSTDFSSFGKKCKICGTINLRL